MNILFLLRLWPFYGGGETVTICLANEMAKRGWNVSILYFKDSTKENLFHIDQKIKSVKIDNINCDEFHAEKKDASKVADFTNQFITYNNINFIINQWWPAEYIKDINRTGTQVKIISCLHSAFYKPVYDNKNFKDSLKRLLLPFYLDYQKRKAINRTKAFFPYIDKYIFLSPQFQHQFELFSNFDNKNHLLDSIPNPLVFSDTINKEDFSKKNNTVLFVGRMLENPKKVSRLIKIWSKIENDLEFESWNFQIIGEGPDLNSYKEFAYKLGLKRISFEGFQSPLEYYKKARIFVMTSSFEGFAMTLIESQQYGVVPIVMDSFLSLRDIITNDKNGIITPNNDIDIFTFELKKLMKAPERLSLLALNGIETSKTFSIQNIVDKWEKIFKDLV